MSFADIILLFAVSSVLGVIVETVFVYLVRGRLESRRGMVYGPFNQVYGFGAVLLTALLGSFGEESKWVLFAASAVLGGLFESLCSYCQEKVYGTVSWEYSGQAFSVLNGRTNIIYMLFWGVLGSVYIRFIHPWLFALSGKIPVSIKMPVAAVLTVFFIYNLWLSNAAVRRWNQRLNGVSASGRMDIWLDRCFYNARMKRIYPSMVAAQETGRAKRVKAQNKDSVISD